MSASSFENARLICSLHSEFSVYFAREPIRVRKRARILLVLIQTCNPGARVLPGRGETSSMCNRGLMTFSAGGHIIHKLATSYPQDFYAQAALDRQNFKEFSFDKNRVRSHK